MRITTEHPASVRGMPVILDDEEAPMAPAAGLRSIREHLGLDRKALAQRLGYSSRTVENWEQGRRDIPANVLLMLAEMLRRRR